jgi:hypothetical protein
VLRFPNDQVFDEPERVLDEVFQAAWKAGWVPPQETKAGPLRENG